MGQAKQYQIQCEEQGYWNTDTYICADCVVDEYLQNVVKNNLESENCDYCNAESETEIAAPFDIVIEQIKESLSNDYSPAADTTVPWVDGSYLMETYDTAEVLWDFDPGWPESVINAIESSLIGYDWISCQNGQWAEPDKLTSMRYDWERFTSQVMTKTRYLFLSEPFDEEDIYQNNSIPVSEMLNSIGSFVDRHNLYRELSLQSFFRVRVCDQKDFKSFDDVAVPPKDVTGPGRMNPAGIPYFYLAFEPYTAIKETITKTNVRFNIAEFKLTQEVVVLDFTNVPSLPSRLNPYASSERAELSFLNTFTKEIAKPISKDGREHIDYVMTQIISEYFRHRFHDVSSKQPLGIIYRSAKHQGGKNVAFFISDNILARKYFKLESITSESHLWSYIENQ